MKRRIRQAIAWARSDKGQRAIHIGMASMGLSAVVWVLKDTDKRLDALEERGMMPVDDFAKVDEIYALDNRVRVLEGKPPRSKVIDVDALAARAAHETPQVDQVPPPAPVGSEAPQEGQEAP